MGSAVRCCVLLWALCVCCSPGARGQELRERDAVCSEEGCFAVYLQRRTFLDSWRSCKDRGGNLATIKRPEEASLVRDLLSGMEPHGTELRVWIGLQRQPRQCSATRPLRGFTWITGDQDTQYTNWLRDDHPSTCSAPRCVVMTYGGTDNFKWLDGSCLLPVDGFLCRYSYKGMCPGILGEGGGPALYTTPFNLLSTLLTHVPFGSVATMPCPDGTKGDQSVLCMLREDGSVGWSKDAPLCSDAAQNWCDQDNGGCEHYCLNADAHYYCECSEGFALAEDGQSCWPADACHGAPCEFECRPAPEGYHCACPQGYLLAPDGRDCLDVDECLQEPCPHECINAPGTFQCGCGEGYQVGEDEGECEEVDECLDDPCEHACENTPGSYTCHCHLGYAPTPEDPTRCQDTDECQIAGTCQQMCVNYVGGFECYCEEGYELQPDHYSCGPIPDEQDNLSAAPSYPGVTSFLGLSWREQGLQFPWLDQLPDWLTESPSLEWLPTDLEWEEPEPTLLPDWIPDHPVRAVWQWLWPSTSPAAPEESVGRGGTVSQGLRPDVVSEYEFGVRVRGANVPNPESGVVGQEVGQEAYTPALLPLTSLSPTTPVPGAGGKLETPVPGEGDEAERGGRQRQDRSWLVVALLVPLSIFVVVMVALGIVYCTRCAVQPRSKSVTDCYRWITSSKPGAPAASTSATSKSRV
ncbi:hypothetical protein AAFF_G00312890 [Aldrovandia affinis]|uniref:Endosialin n=1 Tax=Aldrovandia affinis TaxID=143900 RepID=A0AAD7WQT5_9TELE|nr:hypothetical protein AAFF_G00312890 [Aldrovandia affinis]